MDRISKKPWYWSYYSAKSRCLKKSWSSYKSYGGRGIKFNLSPEDFDKLWEMDNAVKMKRPSIDRINNDGDYTFSNCRFIEFSENCRLSKLGNNFGSGKRCGYKDSKIYKNNKSGIKGVCWHKRDKVWVANITRNGKTKFLGCFKNKLDASRAYREEVKNKIVVL